jgi:LIVCS family branched-chain amino acid:cation transporter
MSTQVAIEKKEWRGQLTIGLALFSMFFGAGNLIFPLLIGKSVGQAAWYAIAGLAISAVFVPFLGLSTMVLYRGSYRDFFGRLGAVPGTLLLLLLQMILGPFGVIPRLVTLMHAMTKPFFAVSPFVFSIALAGLIFACCYRRQRLIAFLGILTPLLLLGLATLVGLGLTSGVSYSPNPPDATSSFLEGLIGGYNTMDLIAAFMFATAILPYFQREMQVEQPKVRQELLFKKMAFPTAIAAGLLFLTYVGLSFVSAYHGWTLDPSLPSETMLSSIAIKLLGHTGGAIAAITVILACLTTATSLAAIFADYLQKEICRDKISAPLALTITLAITTLFANLGFSGIAAFLGPVLQIVYPGLILLTVLNLLHVLYGFKPVKWPVFLAFAASAVSYISGGG